MKLFVKHRLTPLFAFACAAAVFCAVALEDPGPAAAIPARASAQPGR